MHSSPRTAACLLCVAIAAALSGCTLGPSVLRAGRIPYNEVIQQTADEQLLLNLVRLRYGSSPMFLEVGSVSAQYVVSQSGHLSGTLNENIPFQQINPDALTVGGSIAVEERPTIIYAPLQGEQFAARLMAPIPLETIVLAARNGWRIDRVLRLTVQRINGLDNAAAASGPTPSEAPELAAFAGVADLLRELQAANALRFDTDVRSVPLGGPIRTGTITPADAIAAAKAGFQFEPTPDGSAYALTEQRIHLALRIPPPESRDARVLALVDALDLERSVSSFPLRGASTSMSPGDADFRGIELSPRSLLGAMYYLSHAVKVPEAHRRRGWVARTSDRDGNEFDWVSAMKPILTIQSSAFKPFHAAVAARYRDYWFYIDASDVNSKSTFALLNQLFALQAGSTVSGGLQLTLPVGG